MRPQDGLHLDGERRDSSAGDEEGGRVEQVDEHLVTAHLKVNKLSLFMVNCSKGRSPK